MYILDALQLIAIVAWLVDVIPGWMVFIPFALMVMHEVRKEERREEP